MGLVLRSAGIGALAAMRTFAPPAWIVGPENTRAKRFFHFAAAFEKAFDKMPFVQARTTPPQLIGRVVSGAATAVYAERADPRRFARVAAGITAAIAAAAGTYAAYNLRKRVGARLGLPDALVGAVEDSASIGLGRLLTR